MTSFMIKAHVDREIPQEWRSDADCTFCSIIRNEQPAYRVYEDDKVIVILDILPLRPGHMLVIPKAHYSRLSELPQEFAAAVGITLTKVAKALTQAVDNTALNVVCNQEYAQAVPHVHYHIIPAPKLGQPESPTLVPNALPGARERNPRTMREMYQMEFEARSSLDDDDAKNLLEKIRTKL
ncbi:HIT-like protein [Amanita rubescens]|nr:HIT-like protein [Amanita rubescens]